MANPFSTTYAHSNSRATVPPFYHRNFKSPFLLFIKETPFRCRQLWRTYKSTISSSRIKAINDGGDSYLDMWKKAVERERRSAELERMSENSAEATGKPGKEESPEDLERRSREFQKLLEVSVEERDRVQRMQVIDRAAAAIAAARALLNENSPSQEEEVDNELRVENVDDDKMEDQQED